MTSLDKDIPPRNNRKAGPGRGRLSAIDEKMPHAGLYAPTRPDRYREKRSLTAEQRKNPLLRMAYHRLSQISELRGQYLRDLDTIHGGRRTRSEKFAALAKVSEQMLLRMDLATGVMGWLDVERGQFFLNTQCNIAEDSEISAASFNRLLQSMQLADYVYLRSQKVRLDEKDETGLNLVRTRVLVRFTEKFFAHLGIRYLWQRAKKAAIKKRERELRQIGDLRLARQERASLEELRRLESRTKWERSQQRQAAHSQLEALSEQPTRAGRPEPPREPDRGAMKPDQLMASILAKHGKTPTSK